jgi:PAS domain S-box-containing protein
VSGPGVSRKPARELALVGAGLDVSALLLVVVEADGRVARVNHSFEQATGLSDERLRGTPFWDLAAFVEERARLREACAHLGGDGTFPAGTLFHLARQAGKPRVVDWSNAVVRTDDATPPVAVCVGVSLSERMEANEVLRKTEARQRLLLERVPAVVWSTDSDLNFTSSVGSALTHLGLEPEVVASVGSSIYSYLHTNDPREPMIAAHRRALEGECVDLDTVWLGRTFQARVEPLVDTSGKKVGTVGVALDITGRRQMELSLRENEQRLQRIVDANILGIVFWDFVRILKANRCFLDLLGLTSDDVAAGRVGWQELTPPGDPPLNARTRWGMDERGTFTPFETEFLRSDGARVPVLLGGARFEGSSDQGIAFVLDLSEEVRLRRSRDDLLQREKSARLEAIRARQRFQMLAEASKTLAGSLDLRQTLNSLARLLVPALADWCYVAHRGWDGGAAVLTTAHADPSKEELLGTLRTCSPDPAAPEGAPRVFRTGRVAVYADIDEDQLRPGLGRWPVVGTHDAAHLATIRGLGMRALLCVPLAGHQGVDAVIMLVSASDPRRYGPDEIALAQEIAQRAVVTLENVRLFSDALDAVRARDEFLAVAAHELRTPITSTLLCLQRLRRLVARAGIGASASTSPVPSPTSLATASLAESCDRQLQKLSLLMDQLLDVSRIATQRFALRLEEVDAVQLVRDAIASLSPDLQRAGCPVDLAAPQRLVGRWDATRLGQVMTNLIGNALKFGAGQPIEVTVEALACRVRLSVRDHGIGISIQDQARIFGRFERAVSIANFGGLGLGLYVSEEIARALGGDIHVDSQPGQGALFVVDLPRDSAAA